MGILRMGILRMLVELSRLRQNRVVWNLSLGGSATRLRQSPMTGDIVAFCSAESQCTRPVSSRFLRPLTARTGQIVWKTDVRQPQTSLLCSRRLRAICCGQDALLRPLPMRQASRRRGLRRQRLHPAQETPAVGTTPSRLPIGYCGFSQPRLRQLMTEHQSLC